MSSASSETRFPRGRDTRPGARLIVLGLGSNIQGKEQIAKAIERIEFCFDLLVKSTRYIGPAEGGPNDQSDAAATDASNDGASSASSSDSSPASSSPASPSRGRDLTSQDESIDDLSIYSNAAVLIRTADSFKDVRKTLRLIEKELGRTREDPRRVEIDIDILLIQGEIVRNKHDEIVVPHPDLATKRHAAIPSAEVAPSLTHPKTKERLGEIAARLA